MECGVFHFGSLIYYRFAYANFFPISGNQQFILSSVIHHLDHKNVSHDPQVKSNVVQIATSLARQIRTEAVFWDSGFISDLCRHLRKSLQATVDPVGEEVLNLNISLQNTIEDCLLEIAKGVNPSTTWCLSFFSCFSVLPFILLGNWHLNWSWFGAVRLLIQDRYLTWWR